MSSNATKPPRSNPFAGLPLYGTPAGNGRGFSLAGTPPPHSVILGLDPRIHATPGAWIVGSSPTMTEERSGKLQHSALARNGPSYLLSATSPPHSVILELAPRIQSAPAAWMVGSSPTMTKERFSGLRPRLVWSADTNHQTFLCPVAPSPIVLICTQRHTRPP